MLIWEVKHGTVKMRERRNEVWRDGKRCEVIQCRRLLLLHNELKRQKTVFWTVRAFGNSLNGMHGKAVFQISLVKRKTFICQAHFRVLFILVKVYHKRS